MNVLEVCLIVCLISIPRLSYAVSLSEKCGFGSREALVAEAQAVVMRFSNLTIDDYNLRDSGIGELPVPSADQILNAVFQQNESQIFQSTALKVPKGTGILTTILGDSTRCFGLPCAIPNSFIVLFPTSWLQQLMSRMSPSDFQKTTLNLLAHEMGHHVYDIELINDPNRDPSKPAVSVDGPLTPLKYHLTVDAIGTILAGTSIDDMIFTLQKAVGANAFEGDGSDRLECLTGLPKSQ